MNNIEKRFMPVNESELRFEAMAGDGNTVTGFALKWNSLSKTMRHEKYGLFKEVIRPGAFSRALANKADVTFNVDHNDSKILARTSAGNLRLKEDNIGLAIDASLPNTTVASDLKENIRVGNISSMSFAFTVNDGGEQWRKEGDIHVRELLDCNLYDVSAVCQPAYNTTEIAVRSFEKYMESREEEAPVEEKPIEAPAEAVPVEEKPVEAPVTSIQLAEALLKLLELQGK